MIGIKVANQTFNASIAKIMRKYISDSISDIKLKVINGEYICMWLHRFRWINTIIAIQQESHEEYIDYFKELLDKKMIEWIDDIETLIEDLGYDSVAYAFRCICCNKVTIVCQNY